MIKKLTITIIISFLLIALVGSAYATEYTNTFNTASFGTGWTTSGTPNFQFVTTAPTVDGTYYAYIQSQTSGQTAYANYSFSNATIIGFDMNWNNGASNGGTTGVRFQHNGTYAESIYIQDGNVKMYDIAGTNEAGFSSVAVQRNYWYHFNITIWNNGQTYSVVITNSTTHAQISAQDVTPAKAISNSSKIILYNFGQVAATDGKWDNIYLATAPPLATQVDWSQSDYTAGSIMSFSWSVNNTEYNAQDCPLNIFENSKCNFFARVTYNGEIYTISPNDGNTFYHYINISQNGTFPVPASDNTGNFKVIMSKGTYFATSDVIATSDATVRPRTTAYLSMPSTVRMKTSFDVNYSAGYSFEFTQVYLEIYKIGATGNVLEQRWPLYGGDYAGTGSRSVMLWSSGEYFVRLVDDDSQVELATKLVTSLLGGKQIVQNITTSIITVDNSTYYYGDTITGKFQIDNYNWSNYENYIEIYNSPNNYITSQIRTETYNQSASYWIPILDSNNYNKHYLPGLNTIRLISSNATANFTIASANFTISNTDGEGYGIFSQNDEYCVGDKVIIKTIVPVSGILTVIDFNTKKVYYNESVEGIKTVTLPKLPMGSYLAFLKSSSLVNKRTLEFTVSNECAVPTPTPAAVDPSVALGSWSSNMWKFMAMNAFWGVIITALIVYAVPNMFFAFVMINIECAIGLYDPYKWYILAVLWLGAALYFLISGGAGKVTMGEK